MRILVVEDDARFAALLSRGLREHAYAVDLAGDGESALELLELNSYDAVVLDVMIPAPDGFEVCRRARALGILIPVLMLTARDDLADKVRGLDAGADDYLTKPFEFVELVARLRALLRRGTLLHSTNLNIADLVIDTRRREVSRAGLPLSLTMKEYALLEYLVRNAGRVISRDEISEHVWDESFDPLSNVIDVYINRLRRKIDDGSKSPLIHTKRGVGYVIEQDAGRAESMLASERADRKRTGGEQE